jgi:hypothetical protein
MAKCFDHSVQDEPWRVTKTRPFHHRLVKRRGTIYGHLRKYPDGTVVYWAERNVGESVHIKNGWAIDKQTITVLKAFGVKLLGIKVANGDQYLTRVEWFKLQKDGGRCVNWNWEGHTGARGKLGADQLVMPMEFFAKQLAPAAGTLAVMKIGGSR